MGKYFPHYFNVQSRPVLGGFFVKASSYLPLTPSSARLLVELCFLVLCDRRDAVTAGTVALVFLLWGPPASPGGSPSYQRSALPAAQPGEQTAFLRPGTFKYDFYDARARLEGGLNSTGSFEGNVGPFHKLPAHTLQGCRAYIRAHIHDYEDAAEGMGKVIQDARCVTIPPGHMLGHYTVGGYNIDGQKEDPFAVIENPAEQPGACLNVPVTYPEEMEMQSLEASVRLKCHVYKDPDGYWRDRDCSFFDIDGHTASSRKDNYIHEREDFIDSALDYEQNRCRTEEPDLKQGEDTEIVKLSFTLNHDQ